MSFNIQAESRAKVRKVVEVKDKYTVVHLSTSEKKDKNSDEYVYSDWGYARLVWKAHEKGVAEGDVISITSAKVSFARYKKDTEWISPKNPQVTVFDFEVFKSSGKPASEPKMSENAVEVSDEDSIPF